MAQPKVLVGINAYGGQDGCRAKYVDAMLASMVGKTNYPNLTIVAYDDASPGLYVDNVVDKYMDKLPLVFVKGEKPLQQNHRIKNALWKLGLEDGADYIASYDDDYEIVAENWIAHLVACFENIPEIGVLGSHWACLDDGVTRQIHHSPIGYIENNGFCVSINTHVTDGCWMLRRAVIEQLGLLPEGAFYREGPQSDTWYGYKVNHTTEWLLCNTQTDLTWHRGQEFMKSRAAWHTFDESEGRPY